MQEVATPTPSGAPSDIRRERLISVYRRRMEQATDRQEKLGWWQRMRHAILNRSAEQVRRMEEERGLR